MNSLQRLDEKNLELVFWPAGIQNLALEAQIEVAASGDFDGLALTRTR